MLEVKNIRVHYGRVEALKGINLVVEKGTIVTPIGANGAGKTSILRAISGLKTLTSGEIWFEGMQIDGKLCPKIVKLGIAQVPEGRRVFPFMTVLENLRMGAYLRKSKREVNRDIEQLFSLFPILRERRQQLAGSLSGGEQQMLAIGRALMTKPKLLLLDEPSLGLAPLVVRQISQMIIGIYRRGVGIVLVEQNARLALNLAHKAYVLETGSIVLEGDAKKLLNNEYVIKAYLGG